MAVISPEIVLFNTLSNLLDKIEADWNANTDKTKTILSRILEGLSLGNYDLYVEAQAIFLKAKDDPRKLEVRSFFDAERAPIPTIHINLPSEKPGQDGIGIDEGFADTIYDDIALENVPVYTRRFDTQHGIVITSENSWEVITIYLIIKACLVALFDHLQISCLENPKLSGSDLQINETLVPKPVFARIIRLDSSHDMQVASLFSRQTIQDIIYTGFSIDPITGESSRPDPSASV